MSGLPASEPDTLSTRLARWIRRFAGQGAAPPTPGRQSLEQMLDGVEGWLPEADAELLHAMARDVHHCAVEIGAYRGRSTIAMASALRERFPQADQPHPLVYSIDPHLPFKGVFGGEFGPADREAYYRNLLGTGLARYAALINLASQAAARGWDQPIDLLFVDGDHRYEAVSQDALVWSSHVLPGGHIVFDDAFIPDSGPDRAIADMLATDEYEEVPQPASKLRVLCKIATP